MCLICVDLQRDKLTSKEARRNLGESYVTLEEKHRLEVLKLIWKKKMKRPIMIRLKDILKIL